MDTRNDPWGRRQLPSIHPETVSAIRLAGVLARLMDQFVGSDADRADLGSSPANPLVQDAAPFDLFASRRNERRQRDPWKGRRVRTATIRLLVLHGHRQPSSDR